MYSVKGETLKCAWVSKAQKSLKFCSRKMKVWCKPISKPVLAKTNILFCI